MNYRLELWKHLCCFLRCLPENLIEIRIFVTFQRPLFKNSGHFNNYPSWKRKMLENVDDT